MTTTDATDQHAPEPTAPLAAPADAPAVPAPGARCFGDGDPLFEEYHDTGVRLAHLCVEISRDRLRVVGGVRLDGHDVHTLMFHPAASARPES